MFGGIYTNGSPNTQFLYFVTVVEGVNMATAIIMQTNKTKSIDFQYVWLKQEWGKGGKEHMVNVCRIQKFHQKQTNNRVIVWIINTYGTGSRPLLWSHKSNSSFSDVVGIRWHPELFCKWNKCNFNDSLPLFRKWFTPKELLNFAVALFQIAIDMHCAIQLFCLLIKYCWCSLKYNTSLEQQ